MGLIVNNVISSNSQISYSYLGTTENFGYKVDLNYKIKVEDIQFDNNDGILLSGRAAIREAYKRRNITARIAGDEIQNGLVKSISFPQGSLNGEETVDVSIEERRRLSDYSSKTFAKYIPSPHLLSSFSENYSFERNGSNYSYSRDISISYAQDANEQFLTNAKIFLTNYYYENRPSFGDFSDGISEEAKFDKGFNGLLTENIDLVNLSVSLSESFNSSFIDADNNVSKIIKIKDGVTESGYLEKTFDVELTSLRLDSRKVLDEALGSSIDLIISQQKTTFGDPSTIQKGISRDSNKASFSIQFSTDPKKSQERSVVYNCEKRKNGEYFDYNLSVNYKAKGRNKYVRYNEVLNLWTSQKDNNKLKVLALFQEATSIYEKSRQTSISKSNGSVTESIVFTTKDAYDNSNLDDGITKYEVNISKNERVQRSAPIIDIETLKQKIVTSNLNKLGQATVTAIAVASPERGQFHAKNFLNDDARTTDMNNCLDVDGNFYATSDKTTTNISNGSSTRVINYIIT